MKAQSQAFVTEDGTAVKKDEKVADKDKVCPREFIRACFVILVFLEQVEIEELMVVLYSAPPVE